MLLVVIITIITIISIIIIAIIIIITRNSQVSSPGLAVLLVVGCLGDQAELLLRTGASFLTLTSSLLPGEQTFENFPEYL